MERQQIKNVLANERKELLPKCVIVNKSTLENMNEERGCEKFLRRLQSYENPIALLSIQVSPPRLRPPLFHSTSELRQIIDPYLQILSKAAKKFGRQIAEITALDCQFIELQAQKHSVETVEKITVVKCRGTPKECCNGAALINISFNQWKINEFVAGQLYSNREDNFRLRKTLLEPFIESLCVAALFIEDCSEEICRLSHHEPKFLETGAAFFYILVELICDDINCYLPTKQLFSTCIEVLGELVGLIILSRSFNPFLNL